MLSNTPTELLLQAEIKQHEFEREAAYLSLLSQARPTVGVRIRRITARLLLSLADRLEPAPEPLPAKRQRSVSSS